MIAACQESYAYRYGEDMVFYTWQNRIQRLEYTHKTKTEHEKKILSLNISVVSSITVSGAKKRKRRLLSHLFFLNRFLHEKQNPRHVSGITDTQTIQRVIRWVL